MPLNFNYSRAYELVEWIELNRLLGAEKFTIYNYSSAPNVARVLDYYVSLGKVEVVQWRLPIVVDTWPKKSVPEIHYFGQVGTLQDCLFRNKLESEYIVNIDLDEFIIPREENVNTWPDMINKSGVKNGIFVFRNTFFRKEWSDTNRSFENKSIAKKYQLATLLKTRHEARILPHGSRSKYIASTAEVVRLNVHSVIAGKQKMTLVNPDTALLHHYRNWLVFDEPEKNKVEDSVIVRKYASKLTEKVDKIWKTLPDVPLDLHTVT